MAQYEVIEEMERLTEAGPDIPSSPSNDREEQTIRRLEANRTLPSRRTKPSTLKSFDERRADLHEKKSVQRQHRLDNWSCCRRAAYGLKSSVTSCFTSCWESVTWDLRAAFTCSCTFSIWGSPISHIEGYLGSHVSTYFKAMVWLLKINLLCMVLGLGLIVFPAIYIKSTTAVETAYNMNSTCYSTDIIPGDSKEVKHFNSVLQFFTGKPPNSVIDVVANQD